MTKNPRLTITISEDGDFEKLYKKFSPILFKFIAKRLGKSMDVVEEIFQETIVAAWRGYKAFKHKSSFFTWMCRIALNKIADYYHDQVNSNSRIVVPLLDSLNLIDTKNLSPEEQIALKELRSSVNSCLNLLPTKIRQLLWFRYWKDMSYKQIGRILGLSERAVEGKIYRAKEKFAKVWEENK
jgi:RNA polymerase sigma factor (sigma-70 family)